MRQEPQPSTQEVLAGLARRRLAKVNVASDRGRDPVYCGELVVQNREWDYCLVEPVISSGGGGNISIVSRTNCAGTTTP